MVHLFLNCDEYLAAGAIARLKEAMGDADLASLNTAEMAGERVSAMDILGEASMMPFLSERRMVIVTGYLAALHRRLRPGKSAAEGDGDGSAVSGAEPAAGSSALREAAAFLDGLAHLPETADLVLVEPSLEATSPLFKGLTLEEKGDKKKIPGINDLAKSNAVTLHRLVTPTVRELPDWLRARTRELGLAVEPAAIQRLVVFVGNDLRRMENELVKLATFASGRPITAADVQLLVADDSEERVWALTDALTDRDGRRAFRAVAELSVDENPFGILAVIANSYRLIIRAKALMQRGLMGADSLADAMGMKGRSTFPVEKAMKAAPRYTAAQLDAIMERLFTANVAMVTGADQATELELLVADLTVGRG